MWTSYTRFCATFMRRGVAAYVLLYCLTFPVSTVAHRGQIHDVAPKSSSSVIAITNDGTVLLAVNPDSASLTLLDTTTHSVLDELNVGQNPLAVALAPDSSRAYIAVNGENTLSVVDIQRRNVIQSVPVGSRPVGVAVSPDGALVAVTEMGMDRVHLLADSGKDLSTVALYAVADRPYGLTFTADGRRLLVSHLLSGAVTVLPVFRHRILIPYAAVASSRAAHYTDAQYQPIEQRKEPWVTIETWPHVAPASAVIVSADGQRAYLPQTMANGLGLNTGFDTSVFPKISVIDLESWSHIRAEHIPLPERDQPVGLPWDAALTRDDHELWVVNAASNDLSVLDINDPTRAQRKAHISVGDNPRGIVVHPDGNQVYVNNVLAGTVSVIDANRYAVTDVITVTNIPLPPVLLNGKRLFHSSARPDLAQAGWISCNTCHIEGEHDGRTWQIQYNGDVPTGATNTLTRNTTSLLGMIETYPLRWSAEWDESADSEFSVRFEQFGSGLIKGEIFPTQGLPNQGRSYDLDCLAAYIDSLVIPNRPHTLTAAEQRGEAVFARSDTACLDCHPPPLYTDLQQHNVGTADDYGEWFGPQIDTPTLRFLVDSAPYLHDGSAPTLSAVLTTDNSSERHGATSHLTEHEIQDLVAYLLALPYQ